MHRQKNSAHNVGAFANPQRVILYTFQTLPYPVKCLEINTLASSAASVNENRFQGRLNKLDSANSATITGFTWLGYVG